MEGGPFWEHRFVIVFKVQLNDHYQNSQIPWP